jgi:hypothetical protein
MESPGYPDSIMLPDRGLLATCFRKSAGLLILISLIILSVAQTKMPDYKPAALIEQIFLSEV